MAVLAELPFAVETSPLLCTLRVLLLIVVPVYAFFKFTWAFRRYNCCLVLIGCVPTAPRSSPTPRLRSRKGLASPNFMAVVGIAMDQIRAACFALPRPAGRP